jgi:hypothetical protein
MVLIQSQDTERSLPQLLNKHNVDFVVTRQEKKKRYYIIGLDKYKLQKRKGSQSQHQKLRQILEIGIWKLET